MTKIDKHKFSARTYIIRKMFGDTQKEYAKRIGVCERTVRNWEHEKVTRPMQKNFKRVQRRYRYFKNEQNEGIQLKMKRKSDKAVVWTHMRDFEGMFEDIYDNMSEYARYRNEYVIEGFRRVKLIKTKSKKVQKVKKPKELMTTAKQMEKAYK